MRVDDLAKAIHDRRASDARVLHRRLLEDAAPLTSVEEPASCDAVERAIAAAVVEWLAIQRNEAPPAWAGAVGPAPEPTVLVTVRTPKKLARLAEETPPPFRVRNLVAPAGFLRAV